MHYLLKNRIKKSSIPLQKNGTYSKDVRPRWAFVVLKFQGLLQGDLYRGFYIPTLRGYLGFLGRSKAAPFTVGGELRPTIHESALS